MAEKPIRERLSTETEQYAVDNFLAGDTWRIFRIMAEFVEGFESLYRLKRCITFFGSARTKPDHPDYQAAQKSAALAIRGCTIITGGGPGIMEAANRGAKEAGGVSVGINIELPAEQKINPYVNLPVSCHYFFVRKVLLVKYSEAFVIFPGGFGTLDEFMESTTLIQTQRIKPFPIILVGKEFWQPLVSWFREGLLTRGVISEADLDLFHVVKDADEALTWITRTVNGLG